MQELSERRYEALAGYTRMPQLVLFCQEIDGYKTADERVLGVITHDFRDDDYGWVALARDELLRFRCVDVNTSLESHADAKAELIAAMERLQEQPDSAFYQDDTTGKPFDFFTPIIPEERQHQIFKALVSRPHYSCAQELMASLMRYYKDIDGHFVREFQSRNFDARLWEIYLFATFTELRYAVEGEHNTPDFVFVSVFGKIALEATTINPPDGGARDLPTDPDEYARYFENYVPIRYARALRGKVEHDPPYWAMAHTEGLPFVIAIHDFHAPLAMMNLSLVMTEYLFGVRHRRENGTVNIERLTEHRYGNLVEPSGFFNQPGNEHVSAVIGNPHGTVTKFNRMGYLAGFGDLAVKMTRTGIARSELDGGDRPAEFEQRIHEEGYSESWVEGMVVWHNPRALVKLDPDMVPGAAHEFLLPDGRIETLLPPFHPIQATTEIVL